MPSPVSRLPTVDGRNHSETAHAEPADQPRRVQGRGDRVAPQRRERQDRNPSRRHGALRIPESEERRFDHAEGQSGYWAGVPKGAGVTFRFISEPSTALSALQAGEIGWTDSIPTQRVAQLTDDDSIALAATPSNDYWYLALNEAREPWNDVRVRQAIAYALDRDAIVQATSYGTAVAISLRSLKATRGTPRTTRTAMTSRRRKACYPKPARPASPPPRASTCWLRSNIRKR